MNRRGFLASIAGALSLCAVPFQKVWAEFNPSYVSAVRIDFRHLGSYRNKTVRQDLEDAMREHGVI